MFVTDTHPLAWYINGDFSKISNKVLRAFEQAETAETIIYVPAVVLWEIAMLEQLGRIRLSDRFDRWAKAVMSTQGLEHAPLEIDNIHQAVGYGSHRDPFDNLIVATAANLDLPLITKDSAITESNLVEVYW
jgi:PIN domain nuclease of toxin-antitoxin system